MSNDFYIFEMVRGKISPIQFIRKLFTNRKCVVVVDENGKIVAVDVPGKSR